MTETPGPGARLAHRLLQPRDGASLAAFRFLLGAILCAGALRFMAQGWVDILYGRPQFFFHYPGLAWLKPWSVAGMYVEYSALALLAACVALGFCYRAAIWLFFLLFTHVQLLDVTNYLNHYYLVCLLALLMGFMPLQRTWSLDAWLRPQPERGSAPAWCLDLLRFQYAVVYVYAGVAKLGSDWLLNAQPLGIWMASRVELPLIGPLLGEPWVPYAMSWAGCLYDLSVVGFLLWRRTRLPAYLVLLGFHGLTLAFFDIGLFPFIMSAGGLLFFAPDWPRRWLGGLGRLQTHAARAIPAPGRAFRWGLAAALVYCTLQVVVPLRHFAYPGDVLWNEEGMRFAWKVMVREKNGSITYRVRRPGETREWLVNPCRYLEWRQIKEMSGQPDLILQLAHHIAADCERQGIGPVEVRVDAPVSLNGRPSQLLIDPTVDLAQVRDGLAPADWILPGPTCPPLRVGGPEDTP